MVRCSTCGHLKSLHTEGKTCRATVRERGSEFRCSYQCSCNHFYPTLIPKKTWTKKEIERAINGSCLGT